LLLAEGCAVGLNDDITLLVSRVVSNTSIADTNTNTAAEKYWQYQYKYFLANTFCVVF